MSKYSDQLKQWNDECSEKLAEAKGKMDTASETDVESFHKNVLDNIPQQFGDFLYTALGDRVTGQRSSVLNKTYLTESTTGKQIVENAKAQNQTVEEYCKSDQVNNNNRYKQRWNRFSQPQIYITAGRKFGVSYFTGKGDRVHTIYFGAGQCFSHLTQEHVQCVKNKTKRECTQDFLNFRDDFVNGLVPLRNQLVPVSIPVELGVLSTMIKTKKINSSAHGYSDQHKETFTFMDEVIDGKITHIIATVQPLEIWNKQDPVRSYDVKHEQVNKPSYLSVLFLNIDDKHEEISILGNIDINVDGSMHSMNRVDDFKKNNIVDHLNCVNVYNRISQHPAIKETSYQTYKTVDADGVVLNMDKVMANAIVRAEIEKRITFYGEMSGRLQGLKHQHSTLYFLNADI